MADDDLDPQVAAAFAAVDGIEPPDLAERIFGLEPAGAPSDRIHHVAVAPHTRARRRWLAGIAAALVLFGGGIGVGVLLTRGDDGRQLLVDPPPTSTPTTATPAPSATPNPATTSTIPVPTTPAFGAATVTPASASAGETIAVRPAAEIQPVCKDIAAIFTPGPDELTQIGQLSPDGTWHTPIEAASETIFTVPACGMAPSGDAVEYVVPPDLDPGDYVICRSATATDAACGTFTVAAPDAGATPTDPLRAALADLGADIAGAPESASVLGDARWCGAEQRRGPDPEGYQIDEDSRRCLLDAHLAAEPAVLVQLFMTIEGDPIVDVWRTLDDGSVEMFTDMTRDSFGSGRWEVQSCARLATMFPGALDGNPPTTFGCADDGALPMAPVDAAVPDWFTSREVLPSCGYAVRITDVDAVQRECFVQAIEHGQPAEFAYLVVIDGVRTARWFRVTSTGGFEVIEQTITNGVADWQRFACNQLNAVSGTEPGYDVLPLYVPEWCTAGLDAEPPPLPPTRPTVTAVYAPPGTIMATTSPPTRPPS